MTGKRKRSDSVSAKIQAMKNAAADTLKAPPYVGLEKKATVFWNDIIRTKALDSWTPASLITASKLANNYLKIEQLSKRLNKLDSQLDSQYNPDIEKSVDRLHRRINDLQRLALSQSKDLQIHSRAVNGESRDQHKRNQNDADARNILNDMQDDDLLAAPMH